MRPEPGSWRLIGNVGGSGDGDSLEVWVAPAGATTPPELERLLEQARGLAATLMLEAAALELPELPDGQEWLQLRVPVHHEQLLHAVEAVVAAIREGAADAAEAEVRRARDRLVRDRATVER